VPLIDVEAYAYEGASGGALPEELNQEASELTGRAPEIVRPLQEEAFSDKRPYGLIEGHCYPGRQQLKRWKRSPHEGEGEGFAGGREPGAAFAAIPLGLVECPYQGTVWDCLSGCPFPQVSLGGGQLGKSMYPKRYHW